MRLFIQVSPTYFWSLSVVWLLTWNYDDRQKHALLKNFDETLQEAQLQTDHKVRMCCIYSHKVDLVMFFFNCRVEPIFNYPMDICRALSLFIINKYIVIVYLVLTFVTIACSLKDAFLLNNFLPLLICFLESVLLYVNITSFWVLIPKSEFYICVCVHAPIYMQVHVCVCFFVSFELVGY